MNRLTFICKLAAGFVFCLCTANFAQEIATDNHSRIGGLKLGEQSYGYFGTSRHVNKDAEFSAYVNYDARFALWIGAVTASGEILVTCGDGNEMTRRPEWSRERNSFIKQEQTSYQTVNKISSTSFGDGNPFEGHTPLGFRVVQKVYEFKNSRFGLLHYEISLADNAEPLEGVYVGFWADIDAPDYPDRSSPSNDKVGKASSDNAAFIFDGNAEGAEIPLLGAMILGTEASIVSYWKAGDDPNDDKQRYDYLQGNTPGSTGTGDYRFLLSYGPFPLVPGETIQLPVALVQAPELADFEDNLSDAAEFHAEELGFTSLKKRAASLFPTRTSDNTLPLDFALYANFPNPFNPSTQIQFDLKEGVDVSLAIFNGNGQLVRTLVKGFFAAGTYTTTWDALDNNGRQLPSGVYFYKMSAGAFQAQHKLLLLK